jgi:hypothetical protein
MLVVVRSDLDRDDEHRREAERRVIAAETCKKNIEVLIFRLLFFCLIFFCDWEELLNQLKFP